jgi:hypothetical protein
VGEIRVPTAHIIANESVEDDGRNVRLLIAAKTLQNRAFRQSTKTPPTAATWMMLLAIEPTRAPFTDMD